MGCNSAIHIKLYCYGNYLNFKTIYKNLKPIGTNVYRLVFHIIGENMNEINANKKDL